MFSVSSSRSPSESKEKIWHNLRRFSASEERNKIRMMELHIPPTGLGLILLGDLTTIWETSTTSNDDFWKNQEDWEIVRWRLVLMLKEDVQPDCIQNIA
ncbi:hypothetical protein Tco_0059857 [Tanacetum coccineum]